MAFLLPSEFRAPADQEFYSNFDESEYEEMVANLTVIQQAIFDKPVKHRHLKALYVFVDGKPMSKMLVDGGAFVNLMPYTTFRKLSKGPGDLIETDMMLRQCLDVDIGAQTLELESGFLNTAVWMHMELRFGIEDPIPWC